MSRVSSVAVVVVLSALGMGATYFAQHQGAPRIAAEQRQLDSRHVLDVVPPDRYDNPPLEQPLTLGTVQLSNSTLLGGYLATKGGKPAVVLLRSQTTGYGGAIDLLIAIDANGTLIGVKTLKQAETPGLGARIADWPNAWLQRFAGKARNDPGDAGWALKKDNGQFDQMAGATITSRAVIHAIHDALRYFDEHRQPLIGNGAND